MHGAPDDLGWINEASMLSLTGLPRSTFLSWTKSGFLEADPGAAYGEGAVLEIALLMEVRKYLNDQTVPAWDYLRLHGIDTELVNAARVLGPDERFDLVLEPDHAGIAMVQDDDALVAAVRHATAPRPVIVVDVAEALRLARDGFRKKRSQAPRPTQRRAGRPRRGDAEVRVLHRGTS